MQIFQLKTKLLWSYLDIEGGPLVSLKLLLKPRIAEVDDLPLEVDVYEEVAVAEIDDLVYEEVAVAEVDDLPREAGRPLVAGRRPRHLCWSP